MGLSTSVVSKAGPKHACTGHAGQQGLGDGLAWPLRALTFLCPILVGWRRDWIAGSGESAHERKSPWPVVPGPGRGRGKVTQS